MSSVAAVLTRTGPHGIGVALVSTLLMNLYIVGLNQLFDVEIDRVNKPTLPLPSGDLSIQNGRFLVAASLIAGVLMCAAPGATTALRILLLGSAALGTVYSAPPFRLKRFAVLASVCILVVRGLLVNLCMYAHAASAGGMASMAWPPLVRFACAFFVVFGILIAVLKDVPDFRGDFLFNVRTLTVRMGARTVFSVARTTISVLYIAAAAAMLWLVKIPVLRLGLACVHILVGAWAYFASRSIDAEDAPAVYSYYMDIWKAFYLEYLLLPLAALS